MQLIKHTLLTAIATIIFLACFANNAMGIKISTICYPKGLEENTIQGTGLVFGLNGTGDGNFAPTKESLALMMRITSMPVANAQQQLKEAKNVSLVLVQVTIPANGAREGQLLDCKISSIAGKSLEGGRLFMTPLVGPMPGQDPVVYGVSQGDIILPNPDTPNAGVIMKGCRLERDFINRCAENGKITLVLHENWAGIEMATAVADAINMSQQFGGDSTSRNKNLAEAISPNNVLIDIPEAYLEAPIGFLSNLIQLEVRQDPTSPRVTVNRATGTIIVGGDVTIAPLLISHKNMMVQAAGPQQPANGFVAVDPADPQNPTLQGLMNALNAIGVPPEDRVDIIETLHKSGKLYGTLQIQ